MDDIKLTTVKVLTKLYNEFSGFIDRIDAWREPRLKRDIDLTCQNIVGWTLYTKHLAENYNVVESELDFNLFLHRETLKSLEKSLSHVRSRRKRFAQRMRG